MVIWTQIANAVTMISPLISWLHHRRKPKDKNVTGCKRNITRLLLCHIPVSFCYHLLSAFTCPTSIRYIFKVADLSMIHYYALKVSTCFHIKNNRTEQRLTTVSQCMNSVCIMRVCQGHEDTLMRIIGLYLCSYDALKDEHKAVPKIALLGGVSSLLFYYDDKLFNLGHPMFHVMLGFLHHEILKLL